MGRIDLLRLSLLALTKPGGRVIRPGIKLTTIHGREGLLIQPRMSADITRAIVRFARDPALASTLGKDALQRVKANFSVEQMIQATINVYDELS